MPACQFALPRPICGRRLTMSDGHCVPSLFLVRHGESAGNVARDYAEAEGKDVIEISNS